MRWLADQRAELEHLCRYITRPAIANERLKRNRAEQVVLQLKSLYRKALLQAGRQRQWVAARAQLVYLAREWSGIPTKELGRRLHRDPSMISRLYGWYQGHRNKQTEERLARELAK